MPPASRIGDMHVCPKVEPGPVPHVGGPILTGESTVLIGNKPAARVSDKAQCNAPPDSISNGAAGVFISNKKAARIGDPTAHGGVIVQGEPTVIIGDSAQSGVMRAASSSGMPFCEECARARARDVQPRAAALVAAPPPPPSPTPTTPQAEAERLTRKVQAAEPAVTRALTALAAQTGGKMEGLDFRVKSVESLARKIKTDAEQDAGNRSLREVADDIGDVLRYTMILPGDGLTAGYNQTMSELERQGYKVLKVKNTWQADRNDPSYQGYRGINTNLRSPDGQVFELQFHTPESFDMKQTVNHAVYEKVRVSRDPAERAALTEQMRRNSDALVPPRDVLTIKNRR